jgi:hypothetical protein
VIDAIYRAAGLSPRGATAAYHGPP